MKKALWLLVLALATGLIAAGCGDDDSDDGGGTGDGGEPLTKQEFITEADKICSEGDAEIETGADQTFSGDQPPTPEVQEQFATDTVIPNVQSQVDQLGELAPPEGDEDQIQALLDAAQEGIDAGKDDPSLFTGEGDPLAEASQLAKDYGLTVCGS